MRPLVAIVLLLAAVAPVAEAVPTQLGGRTHHVQNFLQTDATSHVLEGFNFIAFQEGHDLSGVTLTPPAGSPVALPQIVFEPPAGSDQFRLESQFDSYSPLNAAFPGGTYTMSLTFTDSTTSSYSLGVPAPLAFPASIPTITNHLPGATVTSLTPTFEFNTFALEPWMEFRTISFTILDSADSSIYGAAFVYDGSMTSFTVSTGLLAPGQFYELSIFFGGQGFANEELTPEQTSTWAVGNLSFTEFETPAAVPEPGTLLLLGSGLAGLGTIARRRRGKACQ